MAKTTTIMNYENTFVVWRLGAEEDKLDIMVVHTYLNAQGAADEWGVRLASRQKAAGFREEYTVYVESYTGRITQHTVRISPAYAVTVDEGVEVDSSDS